MGRSNIPNKNVPKDPAWVAIAEPLAKSLKALEGASNTIQTLVNSKLSHVDAIEPATKTVDALVKDVATPAITEINDLVSQAEQFVLGLRLRTGGAQAAATTTESSNLSRRARDAKATFEKVSAVFAKKCESLQKNVNSKQQKEEALRANAEKLSMMRMEQRRSANKKSSSSTGAAAANAATGDAAPAAAADEAAFNFGGVTVKKSLLTYIRLAFTGLAIASLAYNKLFGAAAQPEAVAVNATVPAAEEEI